MPHLAPPVCPKCNSSRMKEDSTTETYKERLCDADPQSPEISYPVTTTTWRCQRCSYVSAPECNRLKERDREKQKYWLAQIRKAGYLDADVQARIMRGVLLKIVDDGQVKPQWLFDWLLHGEEIR